MARYLRQEGMVVMIPVQLQPEPADFDAKVRQPGHDWLATRGIAFDSAPAVP